MTLYNGKRMLAAGLVLGLNAMTAQAALLSRANGSLIYDTDRNITWVADANLFKTLSSGYTGGANAYMQSVIAANNGVILDTPNSYDGNDGIWNLSSYDFDPSTGRMTWFGAKAWANTLSYGGFDDWRLPSTTPTVSGYGQKNSEMGHLFYTELNAPTFGGILNTEQFVNEQAHIYWSGTESTQYPHYAWYFETYAGTQYDYDKVNKYFAWAVRDGDVVPAPLPGAIWLFVSALLGLLGLKRQRRI